MFLGLPDNLPISNEWLQIDFSTRIGSLRRGQVRVAFYYDFPDSSTFRYRVHNIIDVLTTQHAAQERPDISSAWFCQADGANLDEVADAADILVICRARYSASLSSMITRAKSLHRHVLFDVDDLVVDLDHAHLLIHTLDLKINSEAVWDYWFGYIGRVSATMRMCDRVITTNEFLAEQIRRSSCKHVSIIPNFMNKEQIEYSDEIFGIKTAKGFMRNKYKNIGYFSGSPSHNKDFRIASGSIAKLMKADKSIRLTLVGFLDLEGSISEYSDRIDRIPLQDYLNLQRSIGLVELNIVPLQDNVFTNCKSELKYFEAAAVGTATLASPTFVFEKLITEGENGWLSRSQDWYEKIAMVVATLDDDPLQVFDLATKAREHARSLYSCDKQYSAIRTALLGSD